MSSVRVSGWAVLIALVASVCLAVVLHVAGPTARADCLFVVRYHGVDYLPRWVGVGHGPLPPVVRSVPVSTPSCEADLPPDTYALRTGTTRAYVLEGVPPSVALLYRSGSGAGNQRLVIPGGGSRFASLDAVASHPLHDYLWGSATRPERLTGRCPLRTFTASVTGQTGDSLWTPGRVVHLDARTRVRGRKIDGVTRLQAGEKIRVTAERCSSGRSYVALSVVAVR